MPNTLSTLKSLITAERHHLIEPGALLADLLPYDDTFAHGLANTLECELGIAEIPEKELLAWETVANVMASVERRQAMNKVQALGEMENG